MKIFASIFLFTVFLSSPVFAYSFNDFKWDAAVTHYKVQQMAKDPTGALINGAKSGASAIKNKMAAPKVRSVRGKSFNAKLLKRKANRRP